MFKLKKGNAEYRLESLRWLALIDEPPSGGEEIIPGGGGLVKNESLTRVRIHHLRLGITVHGVMHLQENWGENRRERKKKKKKRKSDDDDENAREF